MIQTSLIFNHKKPSTWDVLLCSSPLGMNACSLASVVPALLHTILQEALLWTRMLKLVWKGTSTQVGFRKWVLVHRGSKDKPAEARLIRAAKMDWQLKKLWTYINITRQHGAAAAHRLSDELWWETGGQLSFWLFSMRASLYSQLLSLSTKPLSTSQLLLWEGDKSGFWQTGCSKGCLDHAWPLGAGLLFPSYVLDMYFHIQHCVPCLLPLLSVCLCKLQPLPYSRPQHWDSQVMVSRRSMQHTKSENPILLAASPYRKVIRRRSWSLAARPVKGRGLTALGTHCEMMDQLWWPCAPCREAGLSIRPHLVMLGLCIPGNKSLPFPRFVHRSWGTVMANQSSSSH